MSVADLPLSWILDGLWDDATAREYCLRSGVEVPDLATVKDFLRFYAASSDPRIDQDLMTTDSLGTVAEWFFAIFTRVTGTVVQEGDESEVYHVS